MKNWLKIKKNRVFFSALILLVVLTVIATISKNTFLLQVTKPLFIPVFLLHYLINNKYINSVFVMFLMLSFLGDFTSVFFKDNMFLKLSIFAYATSYVCLIVVVVNKFKRVNLKSIIGVYLLLVSLINGYFLYSLFNIIRGTVTDNVEIGLLGFQSIALVVLAFSAFAVYLNLDSKKAIVFLMMAISLVFSDVLQYISSYYIYDWTFIMLSRILHVVALFFLFSYITMRSRVYKRVLVNKRIVASEIPSENSIA